MDTIPKSEVARVLADRRARAEALFDHNTPYRPVLDTPAMKLARHLNESNMAMLEDVADALDLCPEFESALKALEKEQGRG